MPAAGIDCISAKLLELPISVKAFVACVISPAHDTLHARSSTVRRQAIDPRQTTVKDAETITP